MAVIALIWRKDLYIMVTEEVLSICFAGCKEGSIELNLRIETVSGEAEIAGHKGKICIPTDGQQTIRLQYSSFYLPIYVKQ